MSEPRQHRRRFAGIDIGTLTCRLLIADLASGHPLTELQSDRRILRLGEGVDQTKRLSPAAMDRVIACLQEWRNVIDGYQVEQSSVVATSAVRDAANRDEFLTRVQREAGFEVEVITGDEEARRTLLGIRSGLPVGVTDILALDIGGGSTEFILDKPGRKPIVQSIDIGVVRLCERVLHHDPPTAEELQQAREWVTRETKAAVAEMGDYRQVTFVGTAGTITSLAAMAQKLPTYESVRIHNYVLMLESIRELEHTLLSKTKAERVGLPGLEKNREEVIAAGAIIIRTIMETLGGIVEAVKSGAIQAEVARQAYLFEQKLLSGEIPKVGVNRHVAPDAESQGRDLELYRVDPRAAEAQLAKLERLRRERDPRAVSRALSRLRDEARGPGNLMEPILDAVRAYATLGEMAGALKDVFGEHKEPVRF